MKESKRKMIVLATLDKGQLHFKWRSNMKGILTPYHVQDVKRKNKHLTKKMLHVLPRGQRGKQQ